MNTKICNNCKEEFPLTEEYFYKCKDGKDGFRNKCMNCMKNIYKNKNDDFDIYKWYSSKSKKFRNTWKLKDIE